MYASFAKRWALRETKYGTFFAEIGETQVCSYKESPYWWARRFGLGVVIKVCQSSFTQKAQPSFHHRTERGERAFVVHEGETK